MIWVYINYLNPHFTIHRKASCGMIRSHQRPEQRVLTVTGSNLDSFLTQLLERKLRFAAQRGLNDVWLQIELDMPGQELGLVHVAQALLGQRYKPLATAPVETHWR